MKPCIATVSVLLLAGVAVCAVVGFETGQLVLLLFAALTVMALAIWWLIETILDANREMSLPLGLLFAAVAPATLAVIQAISTGPFDPSTGFYDAGAQAAAALLIALAFSGAQPIRG